MNTTNVQPNTEHNTTVQNPNTTPNTEHPNTEHRTLGPWSWSPRPWSLVPGPWSMVPGPWSVVPFPSPWSLAHGPVPGPWSLVHGTGGPSEPRVFHQLAPYESYGGIRTTIRRRISFRVILDRSRVQLKPSWHQKLKKSLKVFHQES